MTDPTLYSDHWSTPSPFRDGFRLRASNVVPEGYRERFEQIAATVRRERLGASEEEVRREAEERLIEEVDGPHRNERNLQ